MNKNIDEDILLNASNFLDTHLGSRGLSADNKKYVKY